MRHRFEFQIFARATRVERGTDQLSNVSARLCAVICFAPPLPLLFHLPSPDLRYPADFIYGGTDYVSELIP